MKDDIKIVLEDEKEYEEQQETLDNLKERTNKIERLSDYYTQMAYNDDAILYLNELYTERFNKYSDNELDSAIKEYLSE